MSKQQKQSRRPEGQLRNVGAYARSRLERRSEHAKQTNAFLAAFSKAYEVKQ